MAGTVMYTQFVSGVFAPITGRIPHISAAEALAASQNDTIPPELVSLRENGTYFHRLMPTGAARSS
jgi:hypothetical protein